LPCAEASHDVVLCQLGLQFVPDRPTALAQMRRVPRPGGRLGVSVYGPIEHNPAAFALARALDRHLGRLRRGPSGPSTRSRTQCCCARWPPTLASRGSRS
jgi:ubiquinone/menaquinone biosynthesis C-methylase UbiE